MIATKPLVASEAQAGGNGHGHVMSIPVADVVPAPDNPRQSLGKLDELIASVRAVGILQPLLLTREPEYGRYVIVCGERRWAAAIEAGLKAVPAIVRELSETERVEAMLVENLQRSNLTKMEEANAYERLIQLGYTQKQIAKRVGKSQSYVCRRLLLLTLPGDVRDKVEAGQLPVEQALGYESAGSDDLFAADEQLQRAWMALRQEVLEMGDRRLIRLLKEFAQAFVSMNRLLLEHGLNRQPAAAHGRGRDFRPLIIRAE